MDPEEAYRRICMNVHAILNEEEGDIIELAEAFEALDGWIKSGGFLPRAWSDPSKSAAELQALERLHAKYGEPL